MESAVNLIGNSKPHKSIMGFLKKETQQNIVYINIIDCITPYASTLTNYPHFCTICCPLFFNLLTADIHNEGQGRGKSENMCHNTATILTIGIAQLGSNSSPI